MKLHFYKYEGAGNDFILVDDRNGNFSLTPERIAELCTRRTGIGADGLMLLEKSDRYDFYMRYHNADGGEVAMCGNGGRCIALFSHHLGIGGRVKHFASFDGPHDAEILSADAAEGEVRVGLVDVERVETGEGYAFLNTGVPHHVAFVEDAEAVDVEREGAAIRYSGRYAMGGGANANFVQIVGKGRIKVRTYERGVEGETLACGTGAVASAIAVGRLFQPEERRFEVSVPGGLLVVTFEPAGDGYRNVLLEGPARKVYEGTVEIEG